MVGCGGCHIGDLKTHLGTWQRGRLSLHPQGCVTLGAQLWTLFSLSAKVACNPHSPKGSKDHWSGEEMGVKSQHSPKRHR